ncbi:MAG TPA: valine--tRNA ligase [Elusimicrobia bacterium]|nr:MAG: valine--tRNA ligase [Elusimicrobia bacterium GWF2_62_30]HBA60357.1 valine--tRNA ligase [Elusimicrobiota bacterium]
MLSKVYDPKPVEAKWAEAWQAERLFISAPNPDRKPFVVVIPPPNITGALHMGHALNNTLQDVLVRYQRMLGREAYWVPGTDHGGIATQNVMEKMLKAEGKTRHDLGREEFLKRTWAWYAECGNTILGQLRKLGCSLDLNADNVRFTMDDKRAASVFEEFRSLWDKKLIYRGERMINWCTRCGTALSDIEVEHEDEKSKLWHIRYAFEDGSGSVTVATTRPETMLGDTAVAVHPEDERYKGKTGKKLKLPLTDRLIPLLADEGVEKGFGTGAVKVTPAHDPLDFEIGQRHGLENIRIISYEGKMTNCPEKYAGLNVQAARKLIVEDLNAAGLLEKEEHYKHSVSKCSRCNQHIEPLVSEQWFVKMKGLAAPAAAAAENGDVKFYPPSWKKPFTEWLGNIQDWCISRQIWWGHRIPAWYCRSCSGAGLKFSDKGELSRVSFAQGAKPVISFAKPAACPDCGGTDLLQDPDVLDTWFSSALWPFSVFGWPEKTKELAYYYPTSVLVTGYEILYLWVARMVMSGIEHMGKPPFSQVYLHGIVRDKHGKKMSKSLGNVIDPLTMIEKYGTDAMRFSLMAQTLGGKDIPFSDDAIIGGRNFVNKLYNVARFLQMYLPETPAPLTAERPGELADRWITERFAGALARSKAAMAEYDLPKAQDALYAFVWDELCDWYLELAKPRLAGPDKEKVLGLMLDLFTGALKALHPFIPYITEELYSTLKPYLKTGEAFLLKAAWPEPGAAGTGASAQMEELMAVITQIRAARAQFEIPPGKQIKVLAASSDPAALERLRTGAGYVKLLAKVEDLALGADIQKPPRSVSAISGQFNIYVPMDGAVDLEKEKARLAKELERVQRDSAQCLERLRDPSFMGHAPAAEVEKIKARASDTQGKMERLTAILEELK